MMPPPAFQLDSTVTERSNMRLLFASLVLTFAMLAQAEEPLFGGRREAVTINTDQYEVVVQRNGRVDVLDTEGQRIFDNVMPLVRVFGESKDRPLRARFETVQRGAVKDALGEGQGFTFNAPDFEWRWHTYPSKPYLAVQLTFINTGKESVRVQRLTPWSVGVAEKGAFQLGAGSAEMQFLDNGRLFRGTDDYPEVTQGSALGNWNLAAYNPQTRRSLIAGFLSFDRGYGEFEARPAKDADAIEQYRADSVFDAPVEVAPGGRLVSELLYIALTEPTPHLGLERYGKAVAVWNGKKRGADFLPHGWDSWSTRYHRNIDEASMLRELDALDTKLKRYGWNHFAIDAGWELGKGNWEPDPVKFPNGLRAITDEVHRRGMTAGIWIDPFTVNKNAPVALEHPEWMVKPAGAGLIVLGKDDLILDPTAPGAGEWVKALARRIGHEWGFDALMEADFVFHLLLAEGYHDKSLTKIEVLRKGMSFLREGFGNDKFIMSMTPQSVNGMIADGIRTGRDCEPLWRAPSRMRNWAAVETLGGSIRRWYMAPFYAPDQDCAFFGHDSSVARWKTADKPRLTASQSLAWMTGAALTGGVVKIGEPYTELNTDEVDILRRLLPAIPKPARPLDLFQPGPPRVWYLPLKTDVGVWYVLGLFNWDEHNDAVIPVPFDALELSTQAYFTVFDFWAQRYEGTAQGQLQVRVPPGSVRLLGLRPHENVPMLLASDVHITMGALDHSALAWDGAAKTLSGAFTAIADTPYTLSVLLPEGAQHREVGASAGEVAAQVDGRVVKLRITGAPAGAVNWRVAL